MQVSMGLPTMRFHRGGELVGDGDGRLREDVAEAMAEEDLHGDAGVLLFRVGVVSRAPAMRLPTCQDGMGLLSQTFWRQTFNNDPLFWG